MGKIVEILQGTVLYSFPSLRFHYLVLSSSHKQVHLYLCSQKLFFIELPRAKGPQPALLCKLKITAINWVQ